MTEEKPQLGMIEPHRPLLKQPNAGQKLYKVMTVENFIRSLNDNYLHFQRVDAYKDFPTADQHDGERLLLDREVHKKLGFKKGPDFTAEDYYDLSRSRTYACCFSLENSDYIWKEYGNAEDSIGKICLEFDFEKLRQLLNEQLENAALICNGTRCHQIFPINYGIVEYLKRDELMLSKERLANPILYSYVKEKEPYEKENELRVSLSALGMGQFALADGSIIQFPPSLQLRFQFRHAFASGAIEQILHIDNSLLPYLKAAMEKENFEPVL